MALSAADGAGTPCHCDGVMARAAAEPLYLRPLDHRCPGVPPPKPLSTRQGPSSQQRASGRTRSHVPQSPMEASAARAPAPSPGGACPGGEEAAAGTGPCRTGRGGPGAALMWSAGAGAAQLTLSPTECQQYRLHTAEPNVSFSPWEQTLADGTFWKRCQRVTKDVNLTINTQQRGPLVNREQFQTRKKLKNKTEQNHPPNCWRRPQPGGVSRRARLSCRLSLEAEKHRATPASLSPHPAAASRTSGLPAAGKPWDRASLTTCSPRAAGSPAHTPSPFCPVLPRRAVVDMGPRSAPPGGHRPGPGHLGLRPRSGLGIRPLALSSGPRLDPRGASFRASQG